VGGVLQLAIRPELYAEETETGTNLPVVATTLSKVERKEFCQFLHDLKDLQATHQTSRG
jgi:hypothetical protein